MDEKNETPETQPQPLPVASDDVQQFSRWMSEYGRPALIGLAVAVVVLLSMSIWRNQQKEKAEAAVQSLFTARSPDEFQQMAAADPKASTAPLALASAAAEFYAQRRYDEALSAYQRFLSLYPGHMLEAEAQVGVAATFEAREEYQAAAEAYEAFAKANPAGSLRPQAVMGAARCREQLGQFDEARALYEEFIVANPESTWLSQAESGLLFLKKAERARNAAIVAPATSADELAPAAVIAVEEEEVAPPVVSEPAMVEAPAVVVEAETVAEAKEDSAEKQSEAPAKEKAKKKPSKKKAAEKAPAVE